MGRDCGGKGGIEKDDVGAGMVRRAEKREAGRYWMGLRHI